ncbi:MAG: hypothetical protein JW917_10700 [Ignavibacteria bacterium]|nr:hypothetical protein [Ignavibacteria bacterium]
MKKVYKYLPLFLISGFFALLVYYGCEPKLDLAQFPITNTGNITVSDTTYVQQYPVWTQFNAPEDIFVGKEPLIYVADTRNNRVVQMDLGGSEIGSIDMSGINVNFPKKITQDNNFDLLVICDSAVSQFDTVSVVYRLKLVEGGGIISNARKIRLLSSLEGTVLSSSKRKFTGICTFPDNSFILTRTGPNNSGIDPDNALLKVRCNESVQNVTTYTGFQTTGNGVYSLEKTSSVLVQRNSQTDFILTRNTNDFGFKVLWFEYEPIDGAYEPKFLPEGNSDLIKKQFGGPASVAMDQYMNLYVIDAAYDSVYKYSGSGKLLPGSFGGNGAGENKFNRPMGVAFFDKVLYIADTGNNRIIRFKLSTDIN